ncbi:MAG: AraC family transcriptional regulator [Planctomycetota bacterium]
MLVSRVERVIWKWEPMSAELIVNWSKGVGPSGAALSGDALSELLAELRPTSWITGPRRFAGPFSIACPGVPAGLFTVSTGRMLVRHPPDATPVEVKIGEVVVVVGGETVVLCDHMQTPVRRLERVLTREQIRSRRPVTIGQGETMVEFIGAAMRFDPGASGVLLASLPSVFVVRDEDDGELTSAVSMLRAYASDASAGSQAFLNCVVNAIFVESIRRHLSTAPPERGVLRASSDEQIGPVVALIHAAPAEPWDIGRLAREAGLARSTFCERFRALVGEPPAGYLRTVRLRRAASLLRTTGLDLSAIASRVGYQSQGALGTAFKNWSGQTPGEYRHATRSSHGLRPGDDPSVYTKAITPSD